MKNCRHESPHKQLGHLGCSAPFPTTWEIQAAPEGLKDWSHRGRQGRLGTISPPSAQEPREASLGIHCHIWGVGLGLPPWQTLQGLGLTSCREGEKISFPSWSVLAVPPCPASHKNPTSLPDDTQGLRALYLQNNPQTIPQAPTAVPQMPFPGYQALPPPSTCRHPILYLVPETPAPPLRMAWSPALFPIPPHTSHCFLNCPERKRPLCRADCVVWVRIPNPH